MASRGISRGGRGTRVACSSAPSSSFGMPRSFSTSSRTAPASPGQSTMRTERSRAVLPVSGRNTSCSIATSALPGEGNRSSSSPSSSDPSFVGGLADAARRLARTAQGGLPIVGLLSRLAAPGGGVGWDELAYPEFARALVDADASGEAGFSASGSSGKASGRDSSSSKSKGGAYADAVLRWQERHGKMNGQARYVNLYLWMAFSGGGGLVPARLVALSARRLAVTQDIEIEVERFDQARSSALKDLRGFGPRPRASPADQVALAIDALARLSCGLPDGAPLEEEDAMLLESIVPPALAVARRYSSVAEGKTSSSSNSSEDAATSEEDAVELVRAAVASRGERAKAYE